MTENEYNQLTEKTFKQIEEALDAVTHVDIDYELSGGGILELEFENGSKIIVNRQGAVQEMWVAAKSGGFHYKWQDDAWLNTRNNTELMSELSRLISEQAGVPVKLSS
ncbi:iron donor protein CyaY [Sulfurirhabdus autotrophica]|uniref:Iron-sulfur cluster assembly protein CyaY n=1 Tax=Sulfurirhabdus autotrophica TaxID=1706046 RepID=A0A4R3Y7Y4_9PROT|nr:iron donor protein CyaY [Sulfurirhabdus autotrophica]TCV86393.1 CyaY protein [Sulfurirhabdus autotrophica]